jgi:hypothetical protein
MSKNRSILLNQDYDADIKVQRVDGLITEGLHLGDVTDQNAAIIIKMQPGELKSQPTVGVGIDNLLLDHDYLLYKHLIRQQLTAEGMRVNRLDIDNQNVEINVDYK